MLQLEFCLKIILHQRTSPWQSQELLRMILSKMMMRRWSLTKTLIQKPIPLIHHMTKISHQLMSSLGFHNLEISQGELLL